MWCMDRAGKVQSGMVFNPLKIVFVMRKIFMLFMVSMVLGLCSCSRYPTFFLGDSSGYLQYNRNTGILEVTWENRLHVVDTTKAIVLSDSARYQIAHWAVMFYHNRHSIWFQNRIVFKANWLAVERHPAFFLPCGHRLCVIQSMDNSIIVRIAFITPWT
jgi:hypothetical protein